MSLIVDQKHIRQIDVFGNLENALQNNVDRAEKWLVELAQLANSLTDIEEKTECADLRTEYLAKMNTAIGN